MLKKIIFLSFTLLGYVQAADNNTSTPYNMSGSDISHYLQIIRDNKLAFDLKMTHLEVFLLCKQTEFEKLKQQYLLELSIEQSTNAHFLEIFKTQEQVYQQLIEPLQVQRQTI